MLLIPQGNTKNRSQTLTAYSSAVYSEEAGEWAGADVVLRRAANGDSGFIIFYESYWLEPTYKVFCIDDLRIDGSTGHFSLHSNNFKGRYTIKFRKKSIQLNRDDEKSTGPVVMFAQTDATSLMSRVKQFAASEPCVEK
jgi:hypothetical protein